MHLKPVCEVIAELMTLRQNREENGGTMKHTNFFILILAIVLAGCATTGGSNEPEAKLVWPVAEVPWENVLNRTDSAEVVIICLVNKYDESKLSEPSRSTGPTLIPTERRAGITAADVLKSYLSGVRSLEVKEMMTPSGEPDPKKMAIFIVVSGDQTRLRAGELFTQLGTPYYDNTIPVIYVFHNKKLIASYTYTRNPGAKGNKLKTVVSDLFKAS